jgi:hypothetical protein
MIDTDELDKKSLREKWEVLTEFPSCPYMLRPFVGSRLLDEQHPEDDARSTMLMVELKPGVAHSAVAHLNHALASFLDMPSHGVWIEANAASARRVEITIIKEK